MRDRLVSDDPAERRSAAADLYHVAGDDPDAAAEYAPVLVDLTDGEAASEYATATLHRIVSAGVLDIEAHVNTLEEGVADDGHLASSFGSGVDDRNPQSVTETELRRSAELLAWIAKHQPTDLADEAGALRGALPLEPARPGAMKALFLLSSSPTTRLDVPTKAIVAYVDDDDPRVRGDAIGTVGQLERFGKRHDAVPYFSTLIGAVEDPDVTVKQTALGVLTRGAEYWTHSLSARQLHSAVERVLALCDRESDPTVRSRARSLFYDLASAVVNTAARSALGVDGTPNRAVADGLVETAARDVALASTVATSLNYHHDADTEVRRDTLLDRIAERYPDRFASGSELLQTTLNEDGKRPGDVPALVLDLASVLLDATAE
ncbi:hypothetical protein [Halomontanus rarus]|uniref:hypothetical protein n=1 Tax=Halomontanus rarus TaxID=3034020 RepID=UPI001A986EFC